MVPYPKYDEAQDGYPVKTSGGTSIFAAPITSSGSEKVGAVLEAMSYEGYKTVTPAYYEIALKIKYSSDDETSRMLDLIKDSANADIGEMFAAQIDAPGDKFKNTVGNPANSGKWASTVASFKDSMVAKLDAYIDTVKALG